MLNKSTLTRSEYTLLCVATAVVPIAAASLFVDAYIWSIYKYYYPPAVELSGYRPTEFDLYMFRRVLTLTFAVSFILVFFKRIAISLFLYAVPIGYLVYFLIASHLRLARLLENPSQSPYSESFINSGLTGIFMLTLTDADIILFCMMLFVVGWHIRILMRDYRRQSISLL